jgi:SET domain-containing protein
MPNSVLSPLYCWFNHSCAPNAETGLRAVGSSAIEEQIATRDIEKGEEVCVSYIGDVEVNKAVRSEKLRTWLGNECKCRRCQVEV